MQEELQDEVLQKKNFDEENMALASKLKKGKGKFDNGKKKDPNKAKCFTCGKFGHYASVAV